MSGLSNSHRRISLDKDNDEARLTDAKELILAGGWEYAERGSSPLATSCGGGNCGGGGGSCGRCSHLEGVNDFRSNRKKRC
jgi:hypothetical protein